MGHFIFCGCGSLLNIYMENTNQITVADLDAVRNILDLAASRGAFQGAELTQVGAVYDKLTAFLNSVVAQAKAAQEAAEADGTADEDTTAASSDSVQGG